MPNQPPLRTSLPSTHAASSRATASPIKSSSSRRTPQKSNFKASKPDSDPRHLAIALHHAHRIQSQKDTQDLILNHILELIELPSSPSADPASPSAEDAHKFKVALVPFQPADYDNLILERNIEGLCGYALCPREHRKEDSRGTYRITWGAKGSGPGGRGREMNIVPREKLEMWCSNDCAERALYIRVQLAEEPVWERRADDLRGKELLLLEEGRTAEQGGHPVREAASLKDVVGQLDNLHMERQLSSNEIADDISRLFVGEGSSRARELALERGDANPALQKGRVDVQIQENINPDAMITEPAMRAGDEKGGSIEGYMPRDD